MMKEQAFQQANIQSIHSQLFTNIKNKEQEGSLSTLKGLFYKSITLQSRNYCSNICQVITPIICLLFTLAVRQIVTGITTGAVKTFEYPQPFNMPILNNYIKSQLGLTCEEVYYYQHPTSAYNVTKRIVQMQLKEMCASHSLNPQFIKKDSVNQAVMRCIEKADKLNFQRGDDLKTEIPDGIVKIKQATNKSLVATFAINDFRLPQYHKNNGVTKILVKTSITTTISTYLRVTEGLMSFIDKITRPYLQITNKNEIISGSFMYMPFSGEDKSLMNKAINVLGSGLYPLGLSLLLPLLLYTVVSQKEQRQLQIMKMNGLNVKLYWVNFFIVSFILTIVCQMIMYVVGTYVIEITFFSKTSWVVIWVTFIGWAIAQISMTSFFQIFINNSKTATIIGYILSIFSTLIGVTICTVVFPAPLTLPLLLIMYPPFALSRIIFHLGMACADQRECYRSIFDVDWEVTKCFILLFSWFFVYLFSIWLNQAVQQEYGVARRPIFIQKCLNFLKREEKRDLLVEQQQNQSRRNESIQMDQMQTQQINREQVDQSVKLQYQTVVRSSVTEFPLIIRELSKKYVTNNGQKEKIALKPLTLKIETGEIFGFLGPNGAGKTTLISVLTGMYPQTSGKAWISGKTIGSYETNKMIGVCPQFDILWQDLTVQQHLLFYCRLKNISNEATQSKVKQSLSEVDLYQNRYSRAKQLSGGMQRRLSIAIALVGNPSVIFLDEPSSGLDPFHRRQIWDILSKCKRKTSIFMTSHLMQQVQFLCDRIGIIGEGQLKCVGKINTLKQKYGKGYKLIINYPNVLKQGGKRPKVVDRIIEEFNLPVQDQLETRIVFKIGKDKISRCANLLKNQMEIVWSINKPSLYDVFTHFVK